MSVRKEIESLEEEISKLPGAKVSGMRRQFRYSLHILERNYYPLLQIFEHFKNKEIDHF